MTGSVLLMLLSAALLLDVLISHLGLTRAVRRRRASAPPAPTYPSITVVRPVRGHDVEAEANFAAALRADYPGELETLFVFDDQRDPSYAPAVATVEAHLRSGQRGTARVLVAGSPPAGRTGKLNAMIAGAEAGQGELLAFGDSDTRPDPSVLRVTVDALLASPRGGAAFAPIVARGQPQDAGDAGYALLINAWYGPSVALAGGRTGDLPFIMGQLMVFRREALDVIGGLGCAEGELVDDMHLGRCVARAGYRNVLAPHPLDIVQAGLGLRGFAHVLRRWLIFSRSGLPLAFVRPMWRRGLQFFLALIGIAAAFATRAPLLAIAPFLALGAYTISLMRLYRTFAGATLPWRYAPMTWFMPLAGPLIVLSSLLQRNVTWRGRAYPLSARGALRKAPKTRAMPTFART